MTQAARLVLLAVLAALPVASAGRTPLHRPSTPPVKNSTSPPVCGVPRVRRGQCACWATARLGALRRRGADALLATVLTGSGAMPPRGGSSADEATLRAAVEYMLLGALIPHRRGRPRRPRRA